MKKYIAILFLFAACTTTKKVSYPANNTSEKPTLSRPITECGGVERWNVKTLQDDISVIDFKPLTATVNGLTHLKTIRTKSSTARMDIEKNVYSVTCIIKDFFKEADGDIHIVLQDLKRPNITMIAEIPDPTCSKVSSSKYNSQFVKTRAYFQSFGNDIKGQQVTITGVSFVDIKHGKPQRGVAPNNIELHPVIDLK